MKPRDPSERRQSLRWETLYEALKEAASVLAAIHDAENGKVRADQGIVTLARRGCDEARLALAKARGEA